MFNKKLNKRIKSLENFFSIVYSPSEEKEYNGQHLIDEYGRMKTIDKMMEEHLKQEYKTKK